MKHDYKHLSTHNRLRPDTSDYRNGWESSNVAELAFVVAVTAAMIIGMFYGLSEAVIRGWIG